MNAAFGDFSFILACTPTLSLLMSDAPSWQGQVQGPQVDSKLLSKLPHRDPGKFDETNKVIIIIIIILYFRREGTTCIHSVHSKMKENRH